MSCGSRSQRRWAMVSQCCLLLVTLASGNGVAGELDELIGRRIISPELPLAEVQSFTERRVPTVVIPPATRDGRELPIETRRRIWEESTDELRRRMLDDVVFRGEAAEWRKLPTRVEWLDTISRDGYSIRKLRYEVIPGMWLPGLLYEPLELKGKVPVVLNVNGHDRQDGKAAEYKQIRCINQVQRGMIALNLEWLGMGQTNLPGFSHYRMNQLDLCGTSGIAPFYLAMSRGLDMLLEHEHADSQRVAVAGLSGGGWQTIFISGLDPRVTLANPVAGYSSFRTRARFLSDLGDSEQTPCDMATVLDYTHLTAMRAPFPLLLTKNAEDNCCFRAEHALPPLVEAAAPIYALYDRTSALRTHVNHDPGNHNFQQDNRQQLYGMLGSFFFADDEHYKSDEIACEDELLTAAQLNVELPTENADFHSVALDLRERLNATRGGQQTAETADRIRARLQQTVRPQAMQVQAILAHVGDGEDVTALSWWLRIGGDWTVPCVELIEPGRDTTETVVLLADGGRTQLAEQAKQHLEAGRRVLLVDLFYFGESKIPQRDFLFALLVAAVGERPLGIQCSQLRAIIDWTRKLHGGTVRVEAHGPRNSAIALVTAALAGDTAADTTLYQAMVSLGEVIERDWDVREAPELFCFGLLKDADLPVLERLVGTKRLTIASRLGRENPKAP